MGIAQRLEKLGMIAEIKIDDLHRGGTSLH
jgi:hypothetical protein